MMRLGLILEKRSHEMPCRSMLCGRLFSIKPSDCATSRSRASCPSSVRRLTVIDSLLRPWALNVELRFHGRSPGSLSGIPMPMLVCATTLANAGRAIAPRVVAAKYVVDSTRMISAPQSANCIVAYGPAQTTVMS